MKLTRRAAVTCLSGAFFRAQAWQRPLFPEPDTPPPRQLALAAGPLDMIFEPDLAFLRYIRLDGKEILRGIYAAVRDRNWGTIAPQPANLRVETRDGLFHVSFDVTCKEGAIDFVWRGEITGGANGEVKFSFEGQARSTFERNRIGFCVLHPLEGCAGEPCRVRHSDGTVELGRFPELVSPDQPFKDMTAISQSVLPDVEAEVAFEGDVFEMEDQRNWTDASYKTYCTPLDRPFPVEVPKGTRIRQAVSLKLAGDRPPSKRSVSLARTPILVHAIPNQRRAMPRIGLGQPPAPGASDAQRQRIMDRKFAHLRADITLYSSDWKAQLARAVEDSAILNLPLEAAIHLSAEADTELRRLAEELKGRNQKIARWMVFHRDEKSTSPKWVALARERLATADPEAGFGGGTDAYFAELNRGRPNPLEFEFLCYSINPQVHAFDNASMAENLAGQAHTALTARSFSGGRPIIVSPVTLKPRFNPNATSPGQAPPAPDPRQTTMFGCAWTIGSLKYLAETGVHSITYFEVAGPRGVMDLGGSPYPLFHPLADFADFTGGEVMWSKSERPLQVDSVLVRKDEVYRMLLANLSPEAQVVRLIWPGPPGRLEVLALGRTRADEWNPSGNVFNLPLEPYGYIRITSTK